MLQTSTKEIQDEARRDEKCDPLGIIQEIQIWAADKWFMHKPWYDFKMTPENFSKTLRLKRIGESQSENQP